MTKLNYQESVTYLFSLQKFGIKLGLNSTENILDGLGRPHDGLPILHLAGTNGKGSVGAMIRSVLEKAGLKIGFYSSPHLVTFRERFAINREMISKEDVVRLTEKVLGVCAPDEPPTFFEFVTAMAFQYFKEQKVDLAIMETGLGGRLDATNVAQPLVGVITNISLEHTDHLGPTLAHIAREKAGIAKPGMPLVTGEKRPALLKIFEDAARTNKGRLTVLGRDFKVRAIPGGFNYHGLNHIYKGLKTNLPGAHQTRNAALALAALEMLEEKGFKFTENDVRQGLNTVYWPARAEIFKGQNGQADLMLDGAHNPAAAKTLAALIPSLKYRRIHLVLGIMADKDQTGIMAPLLPLTHALYLTRPEYFRSATTAALAERAQGFKGKVTIREKIPEAIETARKNAGPKDLVVVTGSLFTVGEARAHLTGEPMGNRI